MCAVLSCAVCCVQSLQLSGLRVLSSLAAGAAEGELPGEVLVPTALLDRLLALIRAPDTHQEVRGKTHTGRAGQPANSRQFFCLCVSPLCTMHQRQVLHSMVRRKGQTRERAPHPQSCRCAHCIKLQHFCSATLLTNGTPYCCLLLCLWTPHACRCGVQRCMLWATLRLMSATGAGICRALASCSCS